MRQFFAIISLLLLVGCASQATFGDAITEGEPTPIPTAVIPIKPLYDVERGDIIYEQQYSGRVTPITSAQLQFPLDGRVSELYFARLDTVSEGDVIGILETSALQDQLLDAQQALAVAQEIFDSASNDVEFARRRAELNLQLAQLSLEYARSQASRPMTDEDEYTIDTREIEVNLAQLELDELEAGVDPDLQFAVTRAQRTVDDIQAMIDSASIIAPISGQITALTIEVGDLVTAFEPVGIVSDMSHLELTGSISSIDLPDLEQGMSVTMQRTNAPGEVFTGIIDTLPSPFGTSSDDLVHISFDDGAPPAGVEVGTRLTYNVVIDSREGVLWLPTSAIRVFGGRTFVVIQNEGVQQRVDVRLGLQGDGRVEIIEGLEENLTVVGP
ncbi:MAG: biotin/lipoyl-binding protein [Anaerolineaceae bacterium]|nr:biotin/lipoyl-binding protein [Anaerolineae bacterium]MCB9459749.1 biotin/lipoyl-binding protein [Anaerolineaceae bacterium]